MPLMMMADYSANVRAEVARSELTQGQVADHVGLSRSQWERRMSGKTDWRAVELDRIAQVLGIPLERLTAP